MKWERLIDWLHEEEPEIFLFCFGILVIAHSLGV